MNAYHTLALQVLHRVPATIRPLFKTAWREYWASKRQPAESEYTEALNRINNLLDQNPGPSLAEVETAMKGE